MGWNSVADAVDAACVAAFADDDSIAYTHESEVPPATEDIVGAFSEASERIVLEGNVPYSTTSPTLGVHLSDFSVAPKQDDTLVRSGVTYVVQDVEKDSPGVGAMLILTRAPV